MANYSVFFRAQNQDLSAEAFIQKQPTHFKDQLRQAAQMLSTTGKIQGFRAGRLNDGDWSIWLEDDSGERHNFILFISQFELSKEQNIKKPTQKTKELVIIDPNGPRDTIGGQHPSYWSIDSYASRMDAIVRDYFMNVITEIQFGAESKNYSHNSDGSVSIHIDRPDIGFGIHIHCQAKFIDSRID